MPAGRPKLKHSQHAAGAFGRAGGRSASGTLLGVFPKLSSRAVFSEWVDS